MRECLVTCGALIGFSQVVLLRVNPEGPSVGKAFTARITGVRFFSCVDVTVFLQKLEVVESF